MSNENSKPFNLIFMGDVKGILQLSPGIQEINTERNKQIDKYGFTAKWQAENPKYYDNGQLQYAALILLKIEDGRFTDHTAPLNWEKDWFTSLCEKPEKDRIRIAAAFLAAELDRLNYLENNFKL